MLDPSGSCMVSAIYQAESPSPGITDGALVDGAFVDGVLVGAELGIIVGPGVSGQIGFVISFGVFTELVSPVPR